MFADERGKALTPNGRPRHAFRRATQRADWPSHCPRRTTYATPTPPLCWPAGLTVHAVAELLGHSSPALVMARYGHAYADEKAASTMALARLVAARG